jgi:hypothetical protein
MAVKVLRTRDVKNRQGQLGLGVFVDNLSQKASNARRSLEEGQVRLVRGVFRAT